MGLTVEDYLNARPILLEHAGDRGLTQMRYLQPDGAIFNAPPVWLCDSAGVVIIDTTGAPISAGVKQFS